MYATNGDFFHFIMFYRRKREHASSLVMLVVNSFIVNIYWPPVHLTSNVYIFLLSTNTVRKNKCGFKLKCLPLIRNSGWEWQLDYRKLFSTTTTFYFTLFVAGIPGVQGLDKNNMYDSLVLFSFSFVLSLFTISFYRLKVGRVERVWCGGNGACQYADQKSWGKKQYIQRGQI